MKPQSGLLIYKIIVASLFSAVHNIYFHPLASVPGPLLARAWLLWRVYHSLGGRFHRVIERNHARYGPVFRVSPNELSFSSVTSWKAIYGYKPAKQASFNKSKFYDIYGAGFGSKCIGSERNPAKHDQMKKSLSAAFSTKALLEQEAIVSEAINLFVDRVGQEGGPGSGGLNMTKWYEMIAFDILGELAFGESFRSIENGRPHFWSEMVENHLYFITVADNMRHYPLLVLLSSLFAPFIKSISKKHTQLTRDKVNKRLASTSEKKDIFTNLISMVQDGTLPLEEITAHASTLVVAGGETVATCLAATTYELLRNPTVYEKLAEEIRSFFSSYEEIDATSVQRLSYLQATINEGLRIYPPGSQGFPRDCPGAYIDGVWVPQGTEVYTSAWTVTHDEQNFHEPYHFKPERWLNSMCPDLKEASQPFSLGTRACLGRNVAYMELRLILARLLYKYDLKLLDKDLDWEGKSQMHVMWSKPELRVEFAPRCSSS
ncbi:putative cytochrome P450 [Colletotrichum phormii]|uniref:Cytochrome P450 n=1 Tax=Colletotrichum phormii TaxID=359342 RepID=A0AAI9ZTP0_9PEZI|nr:putative cytochrome P450 [Colletotrichum phormii]KAK1638007.1 putative cytochrome P450 [Colletotrichum phormii]